jgi:hypothetical protein
MNRRQLAAATVVTLAALIPSLAAAQCVTLTPTKDNTLYQPSAGEENSNGAGPALFVGSTNTQSARRALLSFDIAGAVPSGMIITSATLTLNVNKTGGSPETIDLHRLTADWGQGASNAGTSRDGSGTAAAPGDATWLHSFYPSASWSTPGGDFSPTVSASADASSFGAFTFPSTSQLVADVQSFLDSPSTNFGWILLGDESAFGSAARIDSSESTSPSLRPTLTLSYTYRERIPGDTNNDEVIDLTDLNNVLNNFGTTGPLGDDNSDGVVDLSDLNAVLNNFGRSNIPGSLSPLPEPSSLLTCLFAASLLPLTRRHRRT